MSLVPNEVVRAVFAPGMPSPISRPIVFSAMAKGMWGSISFLSGWSELRFRKIDTMKGSFIKWHAIRCSVTCCSWTREITITVFRSSKITWPFELLKNILARSHSSAVSFGVHTGLIESLLPNSWIATWQIYRCSSGKAKPQKHINRFLRASGSLLLYSVGEDMEHRCSSESLE